MEDGSLSGIISFWLGKQVRKPEVYFVYVNWGASEVQQCTKLIILLVELYDKEIKNAEIKSNI